MINEVNGNKVYFAKLREGAVIPSKESENAGHDIYSCFEEDYIEIPPHTTKMIPTGICSAFSEDYVMVLKERGSTGTKGIAQRCGIVDSGYRNEIFVPLTNTNDTSIIIVKKNSLYSLKETLSDEYYTTLQNTETSIEGHIIFYPYEKAICQALMIEVPRMDIEEITAEELQQIPSKRGMGALGSSGK